MAKKTSTKKVSKKAVKKTAAKKSVAKKAGRKTGTPTRAVGKTQISISLPEDLVAKIDRLADAQNRNRSNYIATVLEELTEKS